MLLSPEAAPHGSRKAIYAGQGHAGRRNYLPVTFFFLIPVFFHYEPPPTQWDKAFSRIPAAQVFFPDIIALQHRCLFRFLIGQNLHGTPDA